MHRQDETSCPTTTPIYRYLHRRVRLSVATLTDCAVCLIQHVVLIASTAHHARCQSTFFMHRRTIWIRFCQFQS